MSKNMTLVQRRRTGLQDAVGELGQAVISALNRSVDCLTHHDLELA
jgi:phosphate transport system protein